MILTTLNDCRAQTINCFKSKKNIEHSSNSVKCKSISCYVKF